MKIGFAITLYDKFEELKQLVKIIRSWKGDYHISVCCNHPDAYYILGQAVESGEIDDLVNPRHIAQLGEWTVKDGKGKAKAFAHNIRCVENVRASCQALEATDCDIGVHLHSDAWFLSEDKLRELVQAMIDRKKRVAVRGRGLEDTFNPFSSCTTFGNVDDHAIVWDVRWCKDYKVFDFRPEALLYHKNNIHSMWGLVFGVKVGLDNLWYYPTEMIDMHGNSNRSLSPFNLDLKWELLHVNRNTLPDTIGKQLQDALVVGDVVTWGILALELDKWEYPYVLALKHFGYSKKQIDNMPPMLKKQICDSMTIKQVFKNYKHRITDYLITKLFPIPKDIRTWYKEQGCIDEIVGEVNWTGDIY